MNRLKGSALKTALHKKIKSTHKPKSYAKLCDALFVSDRDIFYENDGSFLDSYSENPFGKDPYFYKNKNKFGRHAKAEGESFNREHVIAQFHFNKRGPMKSDFFHIILADGFVNWKRGSLPFGEVTNPIWTSKNGSKVGFNTFGAYKKEVFEPLDEFKGDIARMHFYMATRYENRVMNWRKGDIFGRDKYKVYKDWYLDLLKKWHIKDPVSSYERNRIEVGQGFQGNRNPFIDNPEYVEKIWGK